MKKDAYLSREGGDRWNPNLYIKQIQPFLSPITSVWKQYTENVMIQQTYTSFIIEQRNRDFVVPRVVDLEFLQIPANTVIFFTLRILGLHGYLLRRYEFLLHSDGPTRLVIIGESGLVIIGATGLGWRKGR